MKRKEEMSSQKQPTAKREWKSPILREVDYKNTRNDPPPFHPNEPDVSG